MKQITECIVINRPVSEVFAFFSDARNNAKWQKDQGLQNLQQVPESPVGVGTLIKETWKFLGRKSETTSQVTEFNPDQAYTRRLVKGSAPIKQGSYSFEPVSGGIKITFTADVEAGGLFALAEGQLAAAIKKSMLPGLEQAKEVLEKSAAAAGV